MSARVGIVIPTVPGRERYLQRALAALRTGAEGIEVALRVEVGWPSCGDAWRAGAARLLARPPRPTYLMLTADDLIPAPGYLAAALSLAPPYLPAAFLLQEDDTVWNEQDFPEPSFSRVPFVPAATAGPVLAGMPGLHYYSDVWLGDRLREAGYQFAPAPGYAFRHLWAQEGRIRDPEPDRREYERLRRR